MKKKCKEEKCGKTFESNREDSLFCSNACKQRFYRKGVAVLLKKARDLEADELAAFESGEIVSAKVKKVDSKPVAEFVLETKVPILSAVMEDATKVFNKQKPNQTGKTVKKAKPVIEDLTPANNPNKNYPSKDFVSERRNKKLGL